jgi:hypothetical protein
MDSTPDGKRAGQSFQRCKAVLLCESVIRDEFTHKTTIVGILDTFFVPSFPGYTLPCTIYLRLQGLVGSHVVSVEVRDAGAGAIFCESVGSAEFGNPPDTMPSELRIPLAPIQIEQPGAFELVAFIDQQEIARAHFDVKPIAPEQKP